MVSPTARKNTNGRQAGRAAGAAIATSAGGRSSMQMLCMSFQANRGYSGWPPSLRRRSWRRTHVDRDGAKRSMMQGKALWYVGAGRAELREQPVADAGAGRGAGARAATARSAAAPSGWSCRPGAGERARAHARAVHGRRVSVSGEVRLCHRRPRRGRSRRAADRVVFALHPAPERVHAAGHARCPCPARCSAARAVLAANMETALNAVWDGAPGPADRIAVVGGGVVGLLVAYLCARLPGRAGDRYRHRPRACRARPRARRRLCAASRRAGGLRSRFPRQWQRRPGSRPRCDSPARRPCRRAELVRQRRRRGPARRGVSQPPAAARLEPGRQDRALASRTLDARAPACGGAGSARGPGARRPARAGDRLRRTAGAAPGDFRSTSDMRLPADPLSCGRSVP